MPSSNKTVELILGLVFTLVGAGALTGSVVAYRETDRFLDQAVAATGTVIDFKEHIKTEERRTRRLYAPIINFQSQAGDSIQFEANVRSNPPMYEVGESVELLYDPARPELARINTFWGIWIVFVVCLLVGVPFTLIGVGALYFMMKAGKPIASE